MINGKKVLAIIPARGGSKGIPKKNIKPLNGKPLIAWTIEEAKKSGYIDKLIVSSDSDEILKVAKEFGAEVPFKRPAELAQDDTPGIEPVLHALEHFLEYDYVVLLQPTSPLRNVEDIDGAIILCDKEKASSCVSVTESSKSPFWMFNIDVGGVLTPLFEGKEIPYQRQQSPKVFELNGAVYVSTRESLLLNKSFFINSTRSYIMPNDRSKDIDSMEDLLLCELLLKNR